jgi:4-aminobutyrate aminotransferase
MDCLTANSISTFGGNPVATSAASAVIDYVLDHHLQANARRQGERLLSGLRDLQGKYDVIGDVRGKGLMIGLEFVEPGTMRPNPPAATAVLEHTRQGGLLVGKGGLYGNVIRLAPPMTLTDEETSEGLQILTDAVAHVRP